MLRHVPLYSSETTWQTLKGTTKYQVRFVFTLNLVLIVFNIKSFGWPEGVNKVGDDIERLPFPDQPLIMVASLCPGEPSA